MDPPTVCDWFQTASTLRDVQNCCLARQLTRLRHSLCVISLKSSNKLTSAKNGWGKDLKFPFESNTQHTKCWKNPWYIKQTRLKPRIVWRKAIRETVAYRIDWESEWTWRSWRCCKRILASEPMPPKTHLSPKMEKENYKKSISIFVQHATSICKFA